MLLTTLLVAALAAVTGAKPIPTPLDMMAAAGPPYVFKILVGKAA